MSSFNLSPEAIQSPLTSLVGFIPSFIDVPEDFDTRIAPLIKPILYDKGHQILDLEDVFDSPLEIMASAKKILGGALKFRYVDLSLGDEAACNIHYHPNTSILLAYLTPNAVGTTFWGDSSGNPFFENANFSSKGVIYPFDDFIPLFSAVPQVGDAVFFDGCIFHSKAKYSDLNETGKRYARIRATLILTV